MCEGECVSCVMKCMMLWAVIFDLVNYGMDLQRSENNIGK